MGASLQDERRRHRSSRLIAVASVAVIALVVGVVWFVSILGNEVVRDDGARTNSAGAVVTTGAAPVLPAGPPTPQRLAEAVVEDDAPGLVLQMPIRREVVTGIGFAPRRERGVIDLEPAGRRANLSSGRRVVERFLATDPPGDLTWFQLGDGTPSMVTVGALPGTDAYAPIDGTVLAIAPYRLDGERRGDLIRLQPLGDGQTVVVLRNLDADDELAVGNKVSAGATRLGYVRDMEGAIEAPLARYTHDSGSGLEIYALRVELPDTAGGV